MYVTRPLSLYRKHPSTLTKHPKEEDEGPYSGYLVTTDEESEAQDTSCWGLCKRKSVQNLPFPSDKVLKISYFDDNHINNYQQEISAKKVWFIPVLDQPLSSNLYHVIKANGRRHKGQACISSKEQDIGLWCFPKTIHDSNPRPFDFRNLYQRFKIHRHHHDDLRDHTFFSKSAATDGVPPKFLRKKGWEVIKTSSISRRTRKVQFEEALGLDAGLRSNPPDLNNFPIGKKQSNPIIVGKWYCPFVFVKEELRIRRQMGTSPFYKMTLEQSWEEIYSIENTTNQSTATINLDLKLKRRINWVFGMESNSNNKRISDNHDHGGFVWFRICDLKRGVAVKVGLSVAIVEKMKWIEEEGGWFFGEEEGRVERVLEVSRRNGRERGVWKRVCCYVLVESFVLRRMDGVVVLKSDFRHTHKIQCKCEM